MALLDEAPAAAAGITSVAGCMCVCVLVHHSSEKGRAESAQPPPGAMVALVVGVATESALEVPAGQLVSCPLVT